MTKKTAAWIITSALFACSGVAGLVACSSDPATDNTGGDAPKPDSGGGGGTDATTRQDTGTSTGGDSGGSSDAGTGADTCPKTMPFAPSTNTDGVRCPFQATLPDGGFAHPLNCAVSEHCCIYPTVNGKSSEPSTCNPSGTACNQPDAAVADFQCAENADCVGDAGSVCCIFMPKINEDYQGCKGLTYISGPTKTTCRTACAAGESPTCTADGGECGTGACSAVTAKSAFFGVCR